jgi:hypothetical protein
MRSSPRFGKVTQYSAVGSSALLLLAAGCAAAQAHADPGSRIDRERELKARFSAQYRCPAEDVTVSGSGTTFEFNGCGKNTQYTCPGTQRDAKQPRSGCTERNPGRRPVAGGLDEQPQVLPGGHYEPLPGPPGKTH